MLDQRRSAMALLAALTVVATATFSYVPSDADARAGAASTLEGVLTRVHGDDFVNRRSVGAGYQLVAGDRLTSVAFTKAPAESLVGKKVRLRGRAKGDTFTVVADGASLASGATANTGSNSYAVGNRKVAVILFNFANDTSQPYAPSFVDGLAFNNSDSVAAYYAQNSWGQTTLSGKVFGWYTLANSNTNCSYSTWATAANAAAAADGFSTSAYHNVVYAFPRTSACSWNGLANLPGRNSWLNGTSGMTLRVMAHELGHNFGTHHAQSLSCTEGGVRVSLVSDISKCSVSEYGDPFTVMGAAQRYHHSNFSRANFSWLGGGSTVVVDRSGDYQLKPAAQQSGVTALRVARTSSSWLTLEFRQPNGSAFETFSSTSAVATGVTVRIAPGYTTRGQSKLVDTTPATTSFSDAALAAGRKFTDPLTNVSVTTLSVSSSGAVVRVTFGATSTTVAPSPTPSPTPTATPAPSPTPTPTATPPPDRQAPTAPQNLVATNGYRTHKVSLSWQRSTDNVGVAGYRVYRNGVHVGTASGPSYSDTLSRKVLAAAYYVVAFDAAGNVSPPSAQVVYRR